MLRGTDSIGHPSRSTEDGRAGSMELPRQPLANRDAESIGIEALDNW